MLVAVLTSAARWNVEQPLLTYSVPEELQDQLRLGQLVAVPYGERLVEGIVWELQADEYLQELGEDVVVRPLHAILDPVPALLPHQRILAEWMAEYYVTALAHCALVMLAPGLMQRSQLVLRLAEEYEAADEETTQGLSLRLRALLGLLQADGEVNVERLKKMLGQKQAKEVLQELQQSNLIVQTPQLSLPKARPRVQRIVRLLAQGEALQEWRARMEQQLQPCAKPEEPIRIVVPGGEATLAGFGISPSAETREVVGLVGPGSEATLAGFGVSPSAETREVVGLVGPGSEATLAGFGVSPNAAIPQKVLGLRTSTNRRGIHSRGDRPHYNPWALSGATATLTLPEEDQASILARRQLAAVDLLECSINRNAPWTPNALCKASGLTAVQLHQLVHENIIAIETLEVRRDPLAGRTLVASQPLQLTADQQRALERILACCAVAGAHAPDPILLHGVTGSGKTEVYLQALAALIAQGKRGIMLVPEIALTTQAIQRVAGRFPGRVAIIHSELSMGERYDEWRRIRAGEVDIVIGSRSALFAPVPELGIIIVDEEHEPAYKQGEFKPTYHAREVAVKIGQILRIPIVLGSATPAVETFYRAQQRYYQLVELPGRIGATLPPVEVIDLRNELHVGNTSIISRRLHEELTHVLERGQQAILFLNRRGAASCVLCRDCGFVASCDKCDIPMTYHATERILLCHYCGKQSKVLHFCPDCKSSGIRYFGLGTEKVEETIRRTFPTARLMRWDRDTARTRHAHAQLLDRFANREADILIGTQMIAKGLDLPGVTLVGVVSADIALNLPDYSAAERAFTLLTQVAGRAGRGAEAGHVIIQTFTPHHFCIETAARHAYHEFYHAEIALRQRYGYPPFRQFVKFTYSHAHRHRCQSEALSLCERLTEWIERLGLLDTDIVGPAPALMERLRGKYRWQMIVRGAGLHQLLRVIDAPGWEIDIDPVSAL